MNKFLTKLILNGILIIPFLLVFAGATAGEAIISTFIACIIAYLLVDRFILPRTNNTIATISDIALTYLYFLIVDNLLNWTLTGLELLSLSLAVGLVELFFHFIMAARMKEPA